PLKHALQITTDDGKTRMWPYAQIRQAQGAYAGEQVRLEFGGDLPEMVVVSDPAFLAALHDLSPEAMAHLHDPRTRGRRVRLTVLAAVGVVVVGAILYLYGIPGLAALAAPHVPVSWEAHLGQQVVERWVPEDTRCADPARLAALRDLVERLLATEPQNPYTFHLYVADDPMVNAFAAPGGYIVVFRGLLEQTETPEELAGVLAHEIQHILKRHTTRMVLEQASTGVLLSALSGDVTGTLAFGLEAARTLGGLRYSRTHEREADAGGMAMLAAAGVDPQGMIRFFQTLQEQEPDLPTSWSFLSTHPRTDDRIERLRQLAVQAPPPSTTLLPHADWAHIKSLCQPSLKVPSAGTDPAP
ncbi:MAG: M48 family metallopeptidase, partial [Nitrospirales bacterium]